MHNINEFISNETVRRRLYEGEVITLIRQRYTLDQENAILRKALAGISVEEFAEFNQYVETCKTQARQKYYS